MTGWACGKKIPVLSITPVSAVGLARVATRFPEVSVKLRLKIVVSALQCWHALVPQASPLDRKVDARAKGCIQCSNRPEL